MNETSVRTRAETLNPLPTATSAMPISPLSGADLLPVPSPYVIYTREIPNKLLLRARVLRDICRRADGSHSLTAQWKPGAPNRKHAGTNLTKRCRQRPNAIAPVTR